MTGEQYRKLRVACGTQAEVANIVGVHRVTIAKREAGTLAISWEAATAITNLRNQTAERKKVVVVGAKRSDSKRKKYNEKAQRTGAGGDAS